MSRRSAVQVVTCAHCGKSFRAEILAAGSQEAGVKCPHCRLFMPLGRVPTEEERPSS